MDCSCSALIGILTGKQSWRGRMKQFLEDCEHQGEAARAELGELGKQRMRGGGLYHAVRVEGVERKQTGKPQRRNDKSHSTIKKNQISSPYKINFYEITIFIYTNKSQLHPECQQQQRKILWNKCNKKCAKLNPCKCISFKHF